MDWELPSRLSAALAVEVDVITRSMNVTKIKEEMPLPMYWRLKFPGGKPTLRAMQKQCERGDIPAVKRGGWYVIVEEAEQSTGNDLIDAVLKAG